MNKQLTIVALASILCIATAFSPLAPPLSQHRVVERPTSSALFVYVPDGLSLEQYKRIKAQDSKRLGKDLGRLGPRGFKSRSMQSWQEAYERGEATHSIAPFGYKDLLKQGKIKKEEVPYMVRGGSWDNSDVRGARRLRWLQSDREYANGGYKKEQSVSILGSGPGLDWTGTQQRDTRTKRLFPGFS